MFLCGLLCPNWFQQISPQSCCCLVNNEHWWWMVVLDICRHLVLNTHFSTFIHDGQQCTLGCGELENKCSFLDIFIWPLASFIPKLYNKRPTGTVKQEYFIVWFDGIPSPPLILKGSNKGYFIVLLTLHAGLEFCHFRGKATWPLVLFILWGHKGQMPEQEGYQIKHNFLNLICYVDCSYL